MTSVRSSTSVALEEKNWFRCKLGQFQVEVAAAFFVFLSDLRTFPLGGGRRTRSDQSSLKAVTVGTLKYFQSNQRRYLNRLVSLALLRSCLTQFGVGRYVGHVLENLGNIIITMQRRFKEKCYNSILNVYTPHKQIATDIFIEFTVQIEKKSLRK